MKKEFELEPGVFGTIDANDTVTDPSMTYLDEVEDDCWNIFRKYASFVGVQFDEDSDIDFSIAKEISEKIIELVEQKFDTKFPIHHTFT